MKYSPEEYQRNKVKYQERQRKYRQNPEVRERYLAKAREHSRRWYQIPENRKRRYQYNQASWLRHVAKLEIIAGRKRPTECEICTESSTIAFDHDHKTGKFRGWICERCNTVLGKVSDDILLLRKLIAYLDSNIVK